MASVNDASAGKGAQWADMIEQEDKSSNAAKKSWAAVLGQNLSQRDNNNVLEVILEKDNKGSFSVSDSECSNLMKRICLDQRPGVHVMGAQICPQERSDIFHLERGNRPKQVLSV